MNPAVALVVATYNRDEPLARLLTVLERQTIPRDRWEVVIAVDGSTDGTVATLERWGSRASLPLSWFVQANAGQAAARHAGILRTSASHVIVIDDDMEVGPDFVASHLEASRGAPDKTVVIGKVVPEAGLEDKPLYAAVGEHVLAQLHEHIERGEQAPTATVFITQNVSFPRAMYLGSGGFDSSLRLYEDIELGIRLERLGAAFVFSPRAWAIHHSDVGSYDKWFERQYDYGRCVLRVWEKHDESALLHPLRNFVEGSRLNRALVSLVCPSDRRVDLATTALRLLGGGLQRVGLFEAAIATHKAILSVRYHQGLRDALGSWSELRASERAYRAHPLRPHVPTARGATYEGSTA